MDPVLSCWEFNPEGEKPMNRLQKIAACFTVGGEAVGKFGALSLIAIIIFKTIYEAI